MIDHFSCDCHHGPMVSVHAVNAFNDNYIWIIADGPLAAGRHSATRAIVVDPGDAAPVTRFLDDHGLELAAIFVTHHHHDHVGGVRELTRTRQVAVYGPPDEGIASITHPVRDGDRIQPAQSLGQWVIMRVPGHTRGHIAFLGSDCLFCGDTLFGAGCGRIFDGSVEDLHTSLNKIATLPTTTHVYCAHEYTVANLVFGRQVEPSNVVLAERLASARKTRTQGQPTLPSTLGEEKATNVFLRCDVAEIRQRVSAHCGRDLRSEREVFTALRKWKDEFRAP